VEISLDVEWAHAIAPKAKILLVEAAVDNPSDLINAVDVAVQRGANVVSMSWGLEEHADDIQHNSHFTDPSVTFVAGSGDSGYGVTYPATSPFVVGVGGTSLETASDGTYVSELAWDGSGGGTSAYQDEPTFQNAAQQSGRRQVPDVAYNAGTPVPIYDSIREKGQSGWKLLSGTSAGTPQWAALFAIANSSRAALGKPSIGQVLPGLYTLSDDLHDIVGGRQQGCGHCRAVAGYDTITGLGTPKADLLIAALVAGSDPGVLYESSLTGTAYDVTANAGAGYGLYGRLPFYSGTGNPFPTTSYYTLTAPISHLRVKRLSGVACNVPTNINLIREDGNGLGIVGPGVAVGELCDFPVSGTFVGDKFSGVFFCINGACTAANGTMVLDGSASNFGYVQDGTGTLFQPGGWAFQICDSRGCSGGFQ
jgi:hypothetical protein